ncbi:MAG: HAMP domain-containing sensor histidine kinase [Oscillospiraceae bacterium]
MKFSVKIFLTTILIVCCTFSVGGTLLLSSWLQASLDREIRFAENQNALLGSSLQTASDLLPTTEAGDLRRTVKDILSSVLPKSGAQLPLRVSDGENQSIYKTASFAEGSSAFASATTAQSGYVILRDNSGYTLHYLSHWYFGNKLLRLETIHDISPIFEMRDAQYRSFARLTLILVLVTGVLVFLLSKWMTKPIRVLSHAAKQMSGGNYSARAAIHQTDEIGALAQDFNQMAEALEEKIEQLQDALRREEDFSGSFAHEVKTPLTSIMGYADLLRSRELPQETRFMAANQIFKESKRLEALSFRLLDFMVLKNGALQLESLSAQAFLGDIVGFAESDLLEHGILLRTDFEETAIWVDPALFRTLLLNLLSNAKNAIEGGGIIALKGEVQNSRYQITVSDTGRGIPQEDLRKVTEAFYRVDKARSREKGGTGLGLALCERIAQAHGGTLSIASKEGCGTTVTVTIGGECREL